MKATTLNQIETFPELAAESFKNNYISLLPDYLILRENLKGKAPHLKLSQAIIELQHHLNYTFQTAKKHLTTSNPFWTLNKKGFIHIESPQQLFFFFDIYWSSDIREVPVEYFHRCKSRHELNALMYRDAVCRVGVEGAVDELGRFGREWKNRKPTSNSLNEVIFKRIPTCPVSRKTLEERIGISPNSMRRYEATLKRMHIHLYVQTNFLVLKNLTKEEFLTLKSNFFPDEDQIEKLKPAPELWQEIFSLTEGEILGAKYQIRRFDEDYYLTRQLPNSYFDNTLSIGRQQRRKFRQKVKKMHGIKSGVELFQPKKNFFSVKEKIEVSARSQYIFIYQGAFSTKTYRKTAIFSDTNNLAPIYNLNLKQNFYLDKLPKVDRLNLKADRVEKILTENNVFLDNYQNTT